MAGHIGGAGIAQNNLVEVVFGFAKCLGEGTSLQVQAKAHVFLHGIKLCFSHLVLHATIEMDLRVLHDMVTRKSRIPWKLDGIGGLPDKFKTFFLKGILHYSTIFVKQTRWLTY
ncbi:hypothetical protein ACH5RR_012665 [Cinchona calisaya]|uniref:RNase H type-1 domain-containing protein n=1 Tax=Cinchona calisaya TaxID=153742 RepID=A0ABD3A8H0_9GENT